LFCCLLYISMFVLLFTIDFHVCFAVHYRFPAHHSWICCLL